MIEGIADPASIGAVDDAIRERDGAKHLILADGAAIETWFESAHGAKSTGDLRWAESCTGMRPASSSSPPNLVLLEMSLPILLS